MMRPFALLPIYKDYLWGGTRLKDGWGMEAPCDPLAESWTLAAHPDGDCRALGGPCSGMTLSEIARAHPEAVSPNHAPEAPFPLMVKLIDAKSTLSIQVHPDDAYAARTCGGQGKTEMWYVLDHEPGAALLVGFQREVQRGEVEDAIAAGTLPDLLRRVEVRRGDRVFIPAGTVHAIGGGILLAEVQQNSNLTYRIFDYNRLGPDGRPRELHLAQALDVMRRGPADLEPPGASPSRPVQGGSLEVLADCPQFWAGVLRVEGRWQGAPEGGFLSLLCLEGNGELHPLASPDANDLALSKGRSLFVPADAGPLSIEGKATLLLTSPISPMSPNSARS